MKPTVYLIRGLSGTGKRSLARTLVDDDMIVTADDWPGWKSGQSHTSTNLAIAHNWCQGLTRGLMITGEDIAVCNSFVKLWEMQPYHFMAKDEGYLIQVYQTPHPTRIVSDNTRGTPTKVLEYQATQWESYNDQSTEESPRREARAG